MTSQAATRGPDAPAQLMQQEFAVGRPSEPFWLRAVRRGIDLALATVLALPAVPITLAIAAAVVVSSGRPVFFRQQRVGRGGRLFTCWKFRTMDSDAEQRLPQLLRDDAEFASVWEADEKPAHDVRVTSVGRLLRRTSLDELPQLFNVLRGDMSIVGPRPLVPPETARYGEAMPVVLRVRPGMTGLWQVSGRNSTTYEERIALDLAYATERTLWLDARILAKTVPAVLTGRGAR